MPKDKEINHPCHLLSLPSAKRFWCRHCMTVFEDAITRWRHSRSCRYGVVNNFMRRRELEAKALQNTSVLNPVEARLEQSIQMCDLASSSSPMKSDPSDEPPLMPSQESFNCFICHQRFSSMEQMRVHVKYPCSNSKIITSCAPHPRHSVPVFIDTMPVQSSSWHLPSHHLQNVVHQTGSYVSAETQQQLSTQTSYDIDIQSHQEMDSNYDDTSVVYDNSGSGTSDGITPTNIYVNEQGETVIEVENLDLNSEGGELSLAHLLTQLSQQGIVFDKSRSAQLQAQHEITVSGDTTNALYTTEVTYQQAPSPHVEEEEGQPTAEDAANTLAQLAGFRGFSRIGQTQSDGEAQLISQVEAYSYNNSSSGPNRQDLINSHHPIDITYEYEYSDSLSTSEQGSVTTQQIQQVIASDSQEYEHVKVEHTAAEETIQYYSDASNVTYVTDSGSQHHIQVHSDEISTIEDMKPNDLENNEAGSVLIQHYPVQVNASGQLIISPTNASAHHMHETQVEYVVSEEVKAEDVEIIISDTPEDSTLLSNFNSNSSSQNIESCVLTLESPAQSQSIAESDEFATQTVSMQEIEDPDSKSLPIVEEEEKLMPQESDSHVSNTDHVVQTATSSFEQETVQYNIISPVDSAGDSTDRHSDTIPTGKTEDFPL